MSDERNAQADLALCQAATPGPWEIVLGSGTNVCTAIGHWEVLLEESEPDAKFVFVCDCLPDWVLTVDGAPEDHRPNMELIAAIPEALPYWIRRAQDWEAAATALQADRDRMKGELNELGADGSEVDRENERLKADIEELRSKASNLCRADQAAYMDPDEYKAILTELETALSHPHPGDSLRAALERKDGLLEKSSEHLHHDCTECAANSAWRTTEACPHLQVCLLGLLLTAIQEELKSK